MYRELIHLWGPFSINSFGLCIALGLALVLALLHRNSIRRQHVTDDQIFQIIVTGIIAAFVGGRLLYLLEMMGHGANYKITLNMVLNGGFSILGSIIACITALIIYCLRHKIPIALVFDLLSLYAPLVQAFGRIGCFMAGCCHGIACSSWYAITYADPQSFAPLHTPLHPTQLYSAAAFFIIFVLLHSLRRTYTLKEGQLFAAYLFLASIERCSIDFLRAGRTPVLGILSLHQVIALVLACIAVCIYILVALYAPVPRHESF
jgi:phosphatidylglycerol---prolipoprotein diacylglyceryl transferase